jgi:superfamily II DNA or RNA helicase
MGGIQLRKHRALSSFTMKPLYAVQEASRDRLLFAIREYQSALDASETGTGKTVVGADVARSLGKPTLVICPKIVIPPWKTELAERSVKTLGVINYELLRTGKTEFGHWEEKRWVWDIPEDSLAIWDEVHRCQGTSTKNAKMLIAAKPLSNLLCSATAAEDPTEMRALGYILGLHNLTNYWTWAMRNGCFRNHWGGFEFRGTPELLKSIADQMFPKRGSLVTKSMLADHFTETQIITTPLDIGDDGKVAKIYADMDRELVELAMKSAGDNKGHEHEKLVLMLRARQKVELLKVPVFVELAEDLLRESYSVVIFVNFDATAKALCERLKAPDIIRGGQSAQERKNMVDRFQNNETKIIIANIAAGGVGVSLHDTKGGHPRAAIISPSWNAKDLVQTLGRVHRAGGKTPSLQKVVFAAGSIEEEIEKSVRGKLKQLKVLNPPQNNLENNLNELTFFESGIRLLHIPLDKPTNPTMPTAIADASAIETPHAEFSPSALKYFERCPSYLRREGTNSIAERGTRIHDALETGDFAKLQDDDELSVANICRSFVADLVEAKKWKTVHRVHELRLDIDLGGGTSTFGTCDVFVSSGAEALMVDFKTGWGRIDDAEENSQAQAYVLGAFQKCPELEAIDFYFAIPHRDEISFAKYTRKDIPRLTLRFNTVIRRAEAARDGKLPAAEAFKPGHGICEYCGRQSSCPALADTVLALAKRYEPDNLSLPETVDGAQTNDPAILAELLKLAPIAEAWASSIRKRCIDLAVQEGVDFPGFKRVERRSARKIISAAGAFDQVRDVIPFEEFLKTCESVSIGKLEDAFSSHAVKGEKSNSRQILDGRLRDAGLLKEEQGFVYLKQIK